MRWSLPLLYAFSAKGLGPRTIIAPRQIPDETSFAVMCHQLILALPYGTTLSTSLCARCRLTSHLSGKTPQTACVTSLSRRCGPSAASFASTPCPSLRHRTTSCPPPPRHRRATVQVWGQRSPRRPTQPKTRTSTPTLRSSVNSARINFTELPGEWDSEAATQQEVVLDYTLSMQIVRARRRAAMASSVLRSECLRHGGYRRLRA